MSDTRSARTGDSAQQAEAYAFLNDHEQEVDGNVIEALNAYHVTPAVWSHRDEYAQALAE